MNHLILHTKATFGLTPRVMLLSDTRSVLNDLISVSGKTCNDLSFFSLLC